MLILASNHIITPAGAATIMALPRTNRVLSITERIIMLFIFGFLYGGSSSTNEDGIPHRIVFDSSFDTIKVIIIPEIIKAARIIPAINEPKITKYDAKKIIIIAISVGNTPPAKRQV